MYQTLEDTIDYITEQLRRLKEADKELLDAIVGKKCPKCGQPQDVINQRLVICPCVAELIKRNQPPVLQTVDLDHFAGLPVLVFDMAAAQAGDL